MSSPRATLAPQTFALIGVGVLAVSLSGPLMASMAVPALAISFWRCGISTLLIAPAAALRRRSELRDLTRRQVGWIVGSGLFLAGHFAAWVTSLTMTSVASATAIVSLQVAWVVAWDRFTGVRLPLRAALGLVLAFAGVLVISGVDFSLSPRALLGDLLALAGSISVAAYTVIGGRARASVSTTSYTLICYGAAALVLLAAALAAGQRIVGFGAEQWMLLLLVTLVAQLLGHSVFNHLLDTISPMLVSLALLLEIPGATLLAAALLGQVPPPAAFLGLLMILGGMATVIVHGPDAPDEIPVA